MPRLGLLYLEKTIIAKMDELNRLGIAVIFVVTGNNGTGKTYLAKRILTRLPFYQSFNLGLITKTIRFLTDSNEVTILENFVNENVDDLFTQIIQYSCAEYQRNGVNLLIDGVQIDTSTLGKCDDILGGVILSVSEPIKLQRNDMPSTHFKRKLEIHSMRDVKRYHNNDNFKVVDNDCSVAKTYKATLVWLDQLIDKKLNGIRTR